MSSKLRSSPSGPRSDLRYAISFSVFDTDRDLGFSLEYLLELLFRCPALAFVVDRADEVDDKEVDLFNVDPGILFWLKINQNSK